MVLADSRKISPVPRYSGYNSSSYISTYRAFTFYSLPFQVILFEYEFSMLSYNP